MKNGQRCGTHAYEGRPMGIRETLGVSNYDLRVNWCAAVMRGRGNKG